MWLPQGATIGLSVLLRCAQPEGPFNRPGHTFADRGARHSGRDNPRALLGGTFALSATDASAAVCARGVYRAGCAGPRGAVVAHHPVAADALGFGNLRVIRFLLKSRPGRV